MQFKQVDVDSLKAYPQNARTHSELQIDQIAKSIKEFGFVTPCLIDKKNVVITGHGRLAAAKLLGIKQVPTLRVEHLTQKQIKAYRIADNQLANNSNWNLELLGMELSELEHDNFDTSILGFTEAESATIETINDPDLDAAKEWQGMPEYDNKNLEAYRSLIVHFPDQKAFDEYAKIMAKFVTLTDQTKMYWFPDNTKTKMIDKIYK